MSELTHILAAIRQGDASAGERLWPLVYRELHRLAVQRLAREKPGQTLEPTVLVHEAYLRLVGQAQPQCYRDSSHFFAAAAGAMRRILIEQARRKQAQKRGSGLERRSLDGLAAPVRDDELLALDEALERLARLDPVKAQLVELRFFAGLTGDQAAAVLDVSPSTADRHWVYARAWLQAEVRGT
jgi:RNA polymerase sigma factor (TIGR02999 family)